MKTYLLAAAAAAAIATPAAARDGQPYVGVEGGVLFARDVGVDTFIDFDEDTDTAFDAVIDHKRPGMDLDLILGYDFGMIRAEGELGYKRARHDEYSVFEVIDGDVVDVVEDGSGNTSVVSLMANVLLDFGNDDGASFYVGGGAGWARVKYNFDDDAAGGFGSLKGKGLAWQLIAGVRYAVTPQLDLGLKYRYFRGPDADDDVVFNDLGVNTLAFDADRFKSHSLLASLIFNFGDPALPPPPPPPPPPPLAPPPPATQTCPDGSVILATDSCPLPPPPPPPPPPAPERG